MSMSLSFSFLFAVPIFTDCFLFLFFSFLFPSVLLFFSFLFFFFHKYDSEMSSALWYSMLVEYAASFTRVMGDQVFGGAAIGRTFPSPLPVLIFNVGYPFWKILVVFPHTLLVIFFMGITNGLAGILMDSPRTTNFTHDQAGLIIMLIFYVPVLALSLYKGWRKTMVVSAVAVGVIVVFGLILPYLYVPEAPNGRPFDTMLNNMCREQLKGPAKYSRGSCNYDHRRYSDN